MSKTVLITGGMVRLGSVIADYLESRGYRVLRSSHRPGADILADFMAVGAADKLFTAATARLGGKVPDVIINNAALFTGENLREVNFEVPKRLTELMAENGGEAVVNIIDSRVLTKSAKLNDEYCQSKALLRDYTLSAAQEYLGKLRVNAVAPGPVLAPVLVHEQAGAVPFGRPTPEAVAAAVAFFIASPHTTGTIIPVDSGQFLI